MQKNKIVKKLLCLVISNALMVSSLVIFSACSSDIILENFEADNTYFVTGVESTVLFTVNATGVSDTVNLCKGDTEIVGAMNDNGLDGDITANDGVFSCALIVNENEAKTVEYFARLSNVTSEKVPIFFFERPTQKSAEAAKIAVEKVDKNLNNIENKYTDETGFVSKNSVSDMMSDVKAYLDDLIEDKTILLYKIEDNSTYIKFPSGLASVFSPKSKNTDSIGSDVSMTVITCQPNFTEMGGESYNGGCYELPDKVNYVLEMPDDVAIDIDQTFDNFSFSDSSNYNDSEVTLDLIKSFAENQCIIWHGHGYYGPVVKSCIVTGEQFDWSSWWLDLEYFNDCVLNRIVNSLITGYDNVIISADYIEHYCKDMTNSIVYLAACSSGKDSGMAQAFLDKGATAVVANTDTIIRDYNVAIQYSTFENMTKINHNTGNYYTLQEALEAAKQAYGSDDSDIRYGGIGATPIIFGGENANNYRLADYIPKPVESLSVPTDMVITLGEISVIEPEITPNDAKGYTIKWTSSDESVATVNPTGEAGIVTSLSKGTTVITAELSSGGKTITQTTNLRVASKARDTVLVLDISGSMNGTPLSEMKKSAIQFCNDLLMDEYNNRVGLVFYNKYIKTVDLTSDLNMLVSEIEAVSDGGTTNMEEGLSAANLMLQNQGKSDAIKNVVVMADGLPNTGKTSSSGSMTTSDYSGNNSDVSYANAVIDTANSMMNSYNMYSLGFFHDLSGSERDFAIALMQKLTNKTDGYHQVDKAEDLQFAFGDISETISRGSKIVINIACPVDVNITYNGETLSSANDTYSDTASFGTLQLLGKNKDIKVLSLDDDKEYEVQLSGTGDGTMDYSVNYFDEDEKLSDYRNFEAVPITSTTTINSNTNNYNQNITLNIDIDNDGEIDEIWAAATKSKAEVTYQKATEEETEPTEEPTEKPTQVQTNAEKQEEKSNGMETWMIVLISVCAVLISSGIVVTVVVASNRRKNDDWEIPVVNNGTKSNPESEKKVKYGQDNDMLLEHLIFVSNGSMKGMSFPIKDGETLYLGKDPKISVVVFSNDYKKVSRLHCSVSYDGKTNKYFVTDCSTNGTYLKNKMRLIKGKRTAVAPGTDILLANEDCVITLK